MTLFGRKAEWDQLLRSLHRGIRSIGVTGRAGVGKSALLAELVRVPPPGVEVWDVDLAGAPFGAGMVDEAARRLGLGGRSGATAADAVDLIVARAGRRRIVLAVDHSDDVVFDPDPVQTLLRRCPGMTLLVARHRAPDGLAELVHLHPLPVPDEGASLGEIAENPSIRLFVDRAGRTDPHFRLTDANALDVADICRLVGGLPLAIELAAARVRMVPVSVLARRLRGEEARGGLDLLSARPDSAHVGIREALASACGELTARERRLLELLSGFNGPFPFEAAVAVGGRQSSETMDDLERLIDLHLVEPKTDFAADRAFDILPIVRAYVDETSTPVAGDDHRRRLVLADLLERAASAARSAGPASDAAPARVMRRDLVNEATRLMNEGARAAPYWLVDCAEVLQGFAEASVIGRLLDDVISSPVLAELDPETQARALLWSSYLLAMSPDGSGLAATVSERFEAAIALIDADREPLLSLQAKFLGMMAHVVTGDLVRAIQLATEGADRAEALPQPVWAARFSVWLAAAAYSVGEVARAISIAIGALERGSRLHDSYAVVGAAVFLYSLPPDELPEGIPLPPAEDALALARARGDIMQEGFALAALISVELDAGRHRTAARWAAEALAQCSRRGWSLGIEITLVQTVMIAVGLGEFEFAGRMLGAVRADRERVSRAISDRHRAELQDAERTTAERLGPAAPRVIGAGQVLSIEEAALEAMGWLKAQAESTDRPAPSDGAALTPREREVLQLLAEGESNKQIAQRLGLSVKTVMHHSVAIYRKLEVRGRAEATAYAYRRGLLTDAEPRP